MIPHLTPLIRLIRTERSESLVRRNLAESGRPWPTDVPGPGLLDQDEDGSDRKPVLSRVRGVRSYKNVPRNGSRYHSRVATILGQSSQESQARVSDFYSNVIMYKCAALLALFVACVTAAPAPGILGSAIAAAPLAYSAHPASPVIHAAAPFAYTAHAAPIAYTAHAAPVAYAAHAAPLAYAAHTAHVAYAAPAVSYIH